MDFTKLSQIQLSSDTVIKPFKCSNEEYAGTGVGTFILDSIKYAFTTVKRLGCRFITVDALNSATSFYEKNGFKFFTEADNEDETRLMFYDLKSFEA